LRKELENQVNERLQDMENVINKTFDYRRKVFLEIGDNYKIWQSLVRQEKV